MRPQESHGQQHHVGLDYLRLLCRLHQWATSVGVGHPRYFLHLHARQLAVLSEKLQRVDVPAPDASLFVGESRLQRAWPVGPWVLRVFGSVHGLRHYLYLRHALRALTVSRAYAVGAGVATADHEHVLALGVDELVLGELLAHEHPVLLRQHLKGEIHALQVASGYLEVAGLRRSRADHHGVELL